MRRLKETLGALQGHCSFADALCRCHLPLASTPSPALPLTQSSFIFTCPYGSLSPSLPPLRCPPLNLTGHACGCHPFP